MHLHLPHPHINRFTIARVRDSLGWSVFLVALSMVAMVAIIPIVTGAGPILTLLALVAIVAAICSAVFL